MMHGVSDKVGRMVQSIVSAQGAALMEGRVAQADVADKLTVSGAQTPASGNVDPAALEAAVAKINGDAEGMGARLSLSIDKELNRVLIRFKDPESGDVVRQIPPEAVIEMMKRLKELKGTMFDSQG